MPDRGDGSAKELPAPSGISPFRYTDKGSWPRSDAAPLSRSCRSASVRGDTRLAELARSASGIPDRVPQSGRGPRELGVELRQVGPRQPSDSL